MSTLDDMDNKIKCSSVVSAVIIIICLPLPIAMIAMGAIHKDNCPAEKYIPIYLIVAGIFTIIIPILYLVGKIFLADSDGNVWLYCQIVSGVISPILLAWLIAGNVWVYGLRNKYNATDKTATNYCDNTFYLFAFWCTIVSSILIGVIVVIDCYILLICYMCCRLRDLINNEGMCQLPAKS